MTRLLPGWHSGAAGSGIASGAELIGIMCLALLVVAEVVGYYYGHRESVLREQAHDSEMTEVREQMEPWTLSEEQRQFLIKELSPFRGQKVSIKCVFGNSNSLLMAKDFQSVFSESGWDFGGPPSVSRVEYVNPRIGIEVNLNETEVKSGRNETEVNTKHVPPAARVLITSLMKLGVHGKEVFADPKVPVGQIVFEVGSRPPPQPR